MNKILMIGCGHMGTALLSTWHKKTSNYFTIIDPVSYKLINNKFKKRVLAFKTINEIKNLNVFNIVIFCIKPQKAHLVLKEFKNFSYKTNVLFISIIAGKKISFFKKYLPRNNQFIRVMPNMAASIDKGMSCIVSNKATSKINILKAKKLFKNVGEVLILDNETALDKATAISGSGPGYYFLFIDLFEKAASDLGFSKKNSAKLVLQTALGSIHLLLNESKTTKQLLKKITLTGGTTEAAIKEFNKNNILKKTISNAVKAAYKRAIELGKNRL